MFLTDAQVLQKLSDALQLANAANLPPGWANTVVPDSHLRAYNDIVGALTARGFTLAQITAWDRGAEVEGDLGVYYALLKAAPLLGIDSKFVRTFDRRKELKSISVTTAGAWQPPIGPVGLPTVGEADLRGGPPGEPHWGDGWGHGGD